MRNEYLGATTKCSLCTCYLENPVNSYNRKESEKEFKSPCYTPEANTVVNQLYSILKYPMNRQRIFTKSNTVTKQAAS